MHVFTAFLVLLWKIPDTLCFMLFCSASQFLHGNMLSSVFRAPISFFESTPSGQLLSRFEKEMETIDRNLPDSLASVLYCFLEIFMTFVALTGVVTPKILTPMIFIGMSYRATMARFRPASRDLKRCESKTRSPIYTHFGEAIRGVVSNLFSVPVLVASLFRYYVELTLVQNLHFIFLSWLSRRQFAPSVIVQHFGPLRIGDSLMLTYLSITPLRL